MNPHARVLVVGLRFVCVFLCVFACGCDAGGRLVVSVNTNFDVPGELGFLRVTTRDEAGEVIETRVIPLAATDAADRSAFAVPLSFTVAPAGGDHASAADIEVAGIAPGQDPETATPVVAVRRVVSGFNPGQQHLLRLVLSRFCQEVVCSADQACSLTAAERCVPAAVGIDELPAIDAPPDLAACPVTMGCCRAPTSAPDELLRTAVGLVLPTDATFAGFRMSARPSGSALVFAGGLNGTTGSLTLGAGGPTVPVGSRFVVTRAASGAFEDLVILAVEPDLGSVQGIHATESGAYLRITLDQDETYDFGGGIRAHGPATAVLRLDADNNPVSVRTIQPDTDLFDTVAIDGEALVVALRASATVSGLAPRACTGIVQTVRFAADGASWGLCAGTGGFGYVEDLAFGPDGRVVIAANVIPPSVDFGGGPIEVPNNGLRVSLVAQWSRDGALEWATTFVGAHDNQLAVSPSGVWIVSEISAASEEPWVLGGIPASACDPGPLVQTTRLETDGTVVWTRVLPSRGLRAISADDVGDDLYVLLGSVEGALPSLSIPDVIDGFYLARIDAAGELTWLQSLDSGSGADYFEAKDLGVLSDGGAWVAGVYNGTPPASLPAASDEYSAAFLLEFAAGP